MVYETKLTVRYAETDQMGIAHHSVYPVWYEVARTKFIKSLGISYGELEKMGAMLPVLEVHCHYRLPVRYEDVLLIRIKIQSLGVAKLEFSYEIFRQGEEKPVHTGSTMHGWVNAKDFRPMNLKKHYPEVFRMLAEAYEDE